MSTIYALEIPCTVKEVNYLLTYPNEYLVEELFNILVGNYHGVIHDDALTSILTKASVMVSQYMSDTRNLCIDGLVIANDILRVLYVYT